MFVNEYSYKNTVVLRIELLCSCIRNLPPNRANGVAVFEGSPIRYNRAPIACAYIQFFFKLIRANDSDV